MSGCYCCCWVRLSCAQTLARTLSLSLPARNHGTNCLAGGEKRQVEDTSELIDCSHRILSRLRLLTTTTTTAAADTIGHKIKVKVDRFQQPF